MICNNTNTEKMKYWSLSGFEEVYLEDSYVLDINKSESEIRISLELVLREAHPFYEEPSDNERYCYTNAVLIFSNVSSIEKFDMAGMSKNISIDPDGSVDFGHIDTFEIIGANSYFLTGDWGEMQISSDKPTLLIDGIAQPTFNISSM